MGSLGFALMGSRKKQQQVDFIAGNAGRDLLVAALHTGQKTLHLQAGRLGDELAGCAGRHQLMLAQDAAVRRTKLNHQLLFGVMRNQCNRHLLSLLCRVICGNFPLYKMISQNPIIYNQFLYRIFNFVLNFQSVHRKTTLVCTSLLRLCLILCGTGSVRGIGRAGRVILRRIRAQSRVHIGLSSSSVPSFMAK